MLDSILWIFIFNPICPRTFLNLFASFTVLFLSLQRLYFKSPAVSATWIEMEIFPFFFKSRYGISVFVGIYYSFQLVIIELWRQKFKRIPNQCLWSMCILLHIFLIYLLGLLNIRSCIIGLLDLSFLTCLLIIFFYDKLSYNEVFKPYGQYCWFYTIYFFWNF